MTIRELGGASPMSKREPLFALTDPASWVIICGAAVIAAIFVGTALVVSNFRERAIERNEFELETVSGLLAQHFDRQFDEISAAENFFASYIEQQNLSFIEYPKFIESAGFRAMVKEKIKASADRTSQINIFDHHGMLVTTSETGPGPLARISDRSYFKVLQAKDPAEGKLHQIELVEGPTTGRRRVVIARRISAPNGDFMGVIARAVSPADLEHFLSSSALEDRAILLMGSNARVIARYPSTSALEKPDFFQPTVLNRMASIEKATLRLWDAHTDEQHIVSVRRLTRYPATVIAATTASAALANWHDETQTLILVAFLTAAVTGIMLVSTVRQLKEETRRLDVAMNNMPLALMLFDPSERLIVKNSRYVEMFGPSPSTRIGRKLKDIILDCRSNGRNVNLLERYHDAVRSALRKNGRTQNTIEMPDGRILQIVNQALNEGGWVSTIEDVTERRRSEELTVRLAQFDTLTGLPNRGSFLEHLRQKLLKAGQENRFAVLFLDLDEFKIVNDTLGHHIGDELLRSVALKLKSSLQGTEFVARLGGDEFAFVSGWIPSTDNLHNLLTRIYDAIRSPHECGGHTLSVDASIGIALAPDDGGSSEHILQSADLAMYAAKTDGKKAHRFFEPQMEQKAKERLSLEAELRKAIADGQIEAHFQPIYDLRKRCVVACEALARWQHPVRGFISPAIFIPIAEQAGLIGQIGDIILHQACLAAMTWPDNITVAVNVSPLQLQSSHFSLKVMSALYESNLPAHRLEIEITEAVLISDDEAALKVLHDLRAIGAKIALDDFGTGYSSLSYLLRFPFDKIKIDRCFVDGLTERDISMGIVRAVITMASELHMITTAEGVENEEQLEALRKLGCDQIQGYLILAGSTNERILELLDSSNVYKLHRNARVRGSE